MKFFSSILCVAHFGQLYLGVPLHKETEVVEVIQSANVIQCQSDGKMRTAMCLAEKAKMTIVKV